MSNLGGGGSPQFIRVRSKLEVLNMSGYDYVQPGVGVVVVLSISG